MATMVGTQSNFLDAIKALIELEYDVVEAYETALNRLNNPDYKNAIESFKSDHVRHVNELTALVSAKGEEAPSGPSLLNQWLVKGKVVLADLVNDHTILKAMLSNEDSTKQAYDNLNKRSDIWKEAQDILLRGLEDEKRHHDWLEKTAK